MSRPAALEALAAQPARSALVLDFDGVLAPIVEDPETSAMPSRTIESLGRLAGALGLVAVISGRPAAFLADRIPVAEVRLLGSYGMEQINGRNGHVHPAAAQWLAAVNGARKTLAELLAGLPGVRIEAKPVSVAVHWRQAPDRDAAAAEVSRATARVAEQTGLRLEPGKLVSELRPPVDVDKGTAVAELIAEAAPLVIAYAGDDLGDLPALQVARESHGYALVVDHGAETDPRLTAVADEVFQGTDSFAAWLAGLATAVGTD
ncbi:MAG: trehalose-phosphatase [Actinobacteria bacterium]|nr:trehalose-phosphatase [Actinomycetota bacterium]